MMTPNLRAPRFHRHTTDPHTWRCPNCHAELWPYIYERGLARLGATGLVVFLAVAVTLFLAHFGFITP